MVKLVEEHKAIPNILLEKVDSNISVQKTFKDFNRTQPLSELDPDDMLKILDDNQSNKTIKEFYIKEAQRASATIKLLDKKISEHPTMSSKKIDMIIQLKELYGLRKIFFMNKFNNKPEKYKSIDIKLIDNNISSLQDKLRDQEGSAVFTYQNEFIKLLNLLGQLLTKNNSKKLKDDINQLLKK